MDRDQTTDAPNASGQGTVEQILDEYRRQRTPHGNDLDDLNQSMALIQAGHYREAMMLAQRVQPSSAITVEPTTFVDKSVAQAAFLAAAERARPLFEQAAMSIEGEIEDSRTMLNYSMLLEMLKNDPNW